MARCEGTTKAGTRCKRTAPEGERYCSIHADQARTRESSEQDGSSAQQDRGEPQGDSRWERIPGARHIDSAEDILHVAVGVLATVALFWLIRRGPRFPGL